MPIITNCPACDAPAFVAVADSLIGAYCPHDCEECGETMVVEMTRASGTTYAMADFETDVLPALDGIERIDHDEADVHIYGDPKRIRQY
jgi:hypothetical protein